MATTSSINHINNIAATVKAYLEHYEQEVAGLATLVEQLGQGDRQLSCRSNMIGHLTASALVLRDNRDDRAQGEEIAKNIQVLLIHHRALNRWLQPGGHLDHDEAPEAGARRELMEETGLTAVELLDGFDGPETVFDIDSHLIPANPRKNEGSHYHHDFQYIYRLRPSTNHDPSCRTNQVEVFEISLQEDEVAQFAWINLSELATGQYGKRLERVARKLNQAVQNKKIVTVGKLA